MIQYHDLSDAYRRKIWNQFFDKLQEERGEAIKIDNSARRYVLEEPKVYNHKWNGREIRNGKFIWVFFYSYPGLLCMNRVPGRSINIPITNTLHHSAFQTAVALAEYRFLTKPEMEKTDGDLAILNEADFKQVCDRAMKFKNYLNGVNEGDDEQMRAGRAHWRLAEEDS